MAVRHRQPNELLRQARGAKTQAKLAELTNAEIYRRTGREGSLTAKSLSDLERGWYTWPAKPTRDALCAVLGAAGPEDLGFRVTQRGSRTSSDPSAAAGPTEVPWRPDATVEFAVRLTRSELSVDRRTFTVLASAAVLTGAPLLDPLEGWLDRASTPDPARRRGRLGDGEVRQLEQSAVVFREWGHQYGGGLHRKAVLGQLSDVMSALNEYQSPKIERRLYRVMAQLSGTAASIAWDAGDQRHAQDYYRIAIRAAHAGDDRAFGANALAGMARQMLYLGRPQDALELIRLARNGARNQLSPRVRSMLYTREAWALAAMRRWNGFMRATDLARPALAKADDGNSEPYWISYFDDAELSGVTGGRLLDLARQDPSTHADRAAEHIRNAIAHRGIEAGRSNALDHIGLAETQFLIGNLSEACRQTDTAVEVAERTHSGRVRSQLADLLRCTMAYQASSAVREARDKVSSLLASQPEGA